MFLVRNTKPQINPKIVKKNISTLAFLIKLIIVKNKGKKYMWFVEAESESWEKEGSFEGEGEGVCGKFGKGRKTREED